MKKWFDIFAFALVFCAFTSCEQMGNKPYSLSWQGNSLYITMPYPSIGIVGINELSWGEVEPTELVEDIFKALKSSNLTGNCPLYVCFSSKTTDKYGNPALEVDEPHFLMDIPMSEVPKYVSAEYFGDSYGITNKIIEVFRSSATVIYFKNGQMSVESREQYEPSQSNSYPSNQPPTTTGSTLDFFSAVILNPTSTFHNILMAGYTAENTRLEEKSIYMNLEEVQERFRNSHGDFDQEKFDKAYLIARIWLAELGNADYKFSASQAASYHRDNIFAPKKRRSLIYDFSLNELMEMNTLPPF